MSVRIIAPLDSSGAVRVTGAGGGGLGGDITVAHPILGDTHAALKVAVTNFPTESGGTIVTGSTSVLAEPVHTLVKGVQAPVLGDANTAIKVGFAVAQDISVIHPTTSAGDLALFPIKVSVTNFPVGSSTVVTGSDALLAEPVHVTVVHPSTSAADNALNPIKVAVSNYPTTQGVSITGPVEPVTGAVKVYIEGGGSSPGGDVSILHPTTAVGDNALSPVKVGFSSPQHVVLDVPTLGVWQSVRVEAGQRDPNSTPVYIGNPLDSNAVPVSLAVAFQEPQHVILDNSANGVAHHVIVDSTVGGGAGDPLGPSTTIARVLGLDVGVNMPENCTTHFGSVFTRQSTSVVENFQNWPVASGWHHTQVSMNVVATAAGMMPMKLRSHYSGIAYLTNVAVVPIHHYLQVYNQTAGQYYTTPPETTLPLSISPIGFTEPSFSKIWTVMDHAKCVTAYRDYDIDSTILAFHSTQVAVADVVVVIADLYVRSTYNPASFQTDANIQVTV